MCYSLEIKYILNIFQLIIMQSGIGIGIIIMIHLLTIAIVK